MRIKLDDLTKKTMDMHEKKTKSMLEELKNAKNLSKKNYWAMAL